MKSEFYISAICPVYNESAHIGAIIKFFINANPAKKELIIVDGGSTDGTREIVEEFIKKNNNITIIDNPDKYVPFALNLGIKNSKGNLIVRMDGHSTYADDFFIKIQEVLSETSADIVGGHIRTLSNNPVQASIARVMNTSFGIGDSKVHFEDYNGYSDTVYQGAYKKKVFEEIGYFDERLVKNQDDEFHYRANSHGKKVYVSSEIKTWYFPRSSLRKVFKHYFLFGLYKPLVLKKVKSGTKLRHLIPTMFVLYLISVFFGMYFISFFWIIPLILYVLLELYYSLSQRANLKVILITFITYPIIHIAYGSGFILGFFKR